MRLWNGGLLALILVVVVPLVFGVPALAAGDDAGAGVTVAWTLAGIALGALVGTAWVIARVSQFGKLLAALIPGSTVEPALAKLLRDLADSLEANAKG